MNFSDIFSAFIRKIEPTPRVTTFECPNCWGIQQWENERKDVSYDFRKDTTRIGRSRKGFVQRFVDRHLPRRGT